MLQLSQFLVYIFVHAILEALYARSQLSSFKKMVLSIQGPVQTNNRTVYAIAGYAIYFVATFVLIIQPILNGQVQTIGHVLQNSIAYGGAVYGVFNATNLYLFKNYSTKIAFIDFVYGVASLTALSLCAWFWKHNKN